MTDSKINKISHLKMKKCSKQLGKQRVPPD